jgi:Excalibur calcium-binding domain
MGYRKGYYKKDGTYVQGHTTNTSSRSLKKGKGCVGLFILLFTIAITNSCSNNSASTNCPTKTCSDFSTQSQAQSTFNSDRDCYKKLDADDDGTACENLSN